MKNTVLASVGAIIALAASGPASAQVVIEANGARADSRWGGELGIGYSLPVLPRFKITPAVGALIYAEDNGRYYLDENGGNEACRDSQTGWYSDRDLCDNTRAKAYGRVEATYDVPLFATVGIGARIGDEVKPYGTVAVPLAPKIQLKGNAGDGYYSLGLRLNF
jgi:opacity protein-like surface antigen